MYSFHKKETIILFGNSSFVELNFFRIYCIVEFLIRGKIKKSNCLMIFKFDLFMKLQENKKFYYATRKGNVLIKLHQKF